MLKQILTSLDAWGNVLSGLSGRSDKSTKNVFGPSRLLHEDELGWIYASNGIGTKIIDLLPDDMTRAGWTFTGDEDGKIGKALKDIGTAKHLNRAMKWARLFGGALVILDIADGQPYELPYNWEKGKAPIRGMRVFSSARTEMTTFDFSADPQSRWFEDLEVHTVKRLYGAPFRVHASRCLVFRNWHPVPDTQNQSGYELRTRYWGLSAMQAIFESISTFGTFYQGIGHLGHELTIGKYTISNLDQMVAENDIKSLKNRMRIIEEQKSILHAVLLGKEERYDRDSLTFAGVPEVMDKLMTVTASVAGYPVTKLWGTSAKGLSATGEGDSRDYYNHVEAEQVNILEAPLTRLAQMMNLNLGTPVKQDELGVKFNPVWTPSAEALVAMQKTVADTDKVYLDAGILHEEQVFNNRFKNGWTSGYSIEGEYVEPEEPEIDPEMQAQLLAASKVAKPPQRQPAPKQAPNPKESK